MKKYLVFFIVLNLVIVVRYIKVQGKYQINDNIIEGLSAPRGRILDVNGNILVDNIGDRVLIFNLLNLSGEDVLDVCKKLSDVIELDTNLSDYQLRYYYYLNNKGKIDKRVNQNIINEYNERKITSKDLLNQKLGLISEEELNTISKKEAYIYSLMTSGYSYEDKIIKLNLSVQEYLNINSLNLSGIRTDIVWERTYPYGNTLRDIFGSVSSFKTGIPKELKEEFLNKGYKLNDRVGISNLEYIYDDYLRGEKAKYLVKNNKLLKISDEKPGKDIVLSIDINLQKEIKNIMDEEIIKAKDTVNTKYYNTSYLVVSNPNTGEVIAMLGEKINNDKTFSDYSYYNISSSFTVGSIVKGATISVGYKYNLIDENTKVKDSCLTLKNQKPKCSWKNLGTVNDISALKNSSNYFQFMIATKLTGNKIKNNLELGATKEHFDIYRDVLKDYGLGIKTNIDLVGESSGIKGTTVSDDLLLNMSIGQYDTYTPISLSSYINTIATGKRRSLSLLKYVLNEDGSIFYENSNDVLNEIPIEVKYLERIREGFSEVNRHGTGYPYTNHKFTSSGKTGTSESFLDTNLDGEIDTKTTTVSYVMYAPKDNPIYSLIIVSPNIKYQNKRSEYKYPINQKIVKRVSSLVYNELSK